MACHEPVEWLAVEPPNGYPLGMGFYMTDLRPHPSPARHGPTSPSAKTRVGFFRGSSSTPAIAASPHTTATIDETRCTVTIFESGRPGYLSRDPIGERGGANLYGFGGNRPIMSMDLLGALTNIIEIWMETDFNSDRERDRFKSILEETIKQCATCSETPLCENQGASSCDAIIPIVNVYPGKSVSVLNKMEKGYIKYNQDSNPNPKYVHTIGEVFDALVPYPWTESFNDDATLAATVDNETMFMLSRSQGFINDYKIMDDYKYLVLSAILAHEVGLHGMGATIGNTHFSETGEIDSKQLLFSALDNVTLSQAAIDVICPKLKEYLKTFPSLKTATDKWNE